MDHLKTGCHKLPVFNVSGFRMFGNQIPTEDGFSKSIYNLFDNNVYIDGSRAVVV